MPSKLAPAPGRMINRLVLMPGADGPTGGTRLHASEWRWAAGRSKLACEFPTVSVAVTDERSALQAHVRVREWRELGFDPTPFDEALRTQRPTTVYLQGARDGEAAAVALEVLTRYQGLIARRNRASSTPVFAAVLAALRDVHDLSKPLVAADYWHALDTWQWTLRLWPDAPATVQVAALFHDVERLASEADARVEHYAPDYEAFKRAHARGGAAMLPDILRPAGVRGEELAQVRLLVEGHEQGQGPTREQAVLADADALSFFTVNSAGYLDYFGPEQTHRKVAYTLRRMRRETIARLATVRHRADVERIVVAELLELSGAARPRLAAGAREARNEDRELDPLEIEADDVVAVDDLAQGLAVAAGSIPPPPTDGRERPGSRLWAGGPPPLRRGPAPLASNDDGERRRGRGWLDLGRRGIGGLGAGDLDAALGGLGGRAMPGTEHPGDPETRPAERPRAPLAPASEATPGQRSPAPASPAPGAAAPDPGQRPEVPAPLEPGAAPPARPAPPDPGSPEFWQRQVPLPASPWPPPAPPSAGEPPADDDDDDWPTSLHRADRRRPSNEPL